MQIIVERQPRKVSRRDFLRLSATTAALGAEAYFFWRAPIAQAAQKKEDLKPAHEFEFKEVGLNEIATVDKSSWIGEITGIRLNDNFQFPDSYLFSESPPHLDPDFNRNIVLSKDGQAKILAERRKDVPFSYLTDPSAARHGNTLAVAFNAYLPDEPSQSLSQKEDPPKKEKSPIFMEIPIAPGNQLNLQGFRKILENDPLTQLNKFEPPQTKPNFPKVVFPEKETPPVQLYLQTLDAQTLQPKSKFITPFEADSDHYPYYPKLISIPEGFLAIADILHVSQNIAPLFYRKIGLNGEFLTPQEPVPQGDFSWEHSLGTINGKPWIIGTTNTTGSFGNETIGWLMENGKWSERFTIFPHLEDFSISDPQVAVLDPKRLLVASLLRPVWWAPSSILLGWFNIETKQLEKAGILYTYAFWMDPHSVGTDRYGRIYTTFAGEYYGWRIPPNIVAIGKTPTQETGIITYKQIGTSIPNTYLSFAKISGVYSEGPEKTKIQITANSYNPETQVSTPLSLIEQLQPKEFSVYQ
jgi:hypothetical protein